ncbi:MAG: PPC domain-containing protein [Planctomycetota bacterium]|jgi:hypothetical protein
MDSTHSTHSTTRHRVLGLTAFLLVVASAALAQRVPHVGYTYPAGGKQGTTFDVRVAGQNLGAVARVFVSGPGVSAEVVSYSRPLNGRKFNELREKAQKLQRKQAALRRQAQQRRQQRGRQGGRQRGGKRGGQQPPAADQTWTAEDEKTLREYRAAVDDRNRRRANPALADTAVLRVTIAPDAKLGLRELRLLARGNLTNPMVFCVGDLPEIKEAETPDAQRAQRGRRGRGRGRDTRRRPPENTRLTLPAVANGQIMPGDVDRFRFAARKGQQLVIAVSARELIPYLADAVPGWFQATLTIYDAKGKELAYVDDYRFDPDPVVFFEVPADGDYTVEIRDAIYRGREDFVYRITVGELPFVTSVFPLGGPADEEIPVYVRGWNLPTRKLTVAADRGVGTSAVVVRAKGSTSKAVPFARDTLAECLEQEPNNSPQSAQQVPPALVINGRIGQPGDVDVFRFDARAGQTIVAEVQGRRLRSPIDSMLRLTDANGRQLAFNDDREDKGAGLTTHHADSWLRHTLPRNGTYYVYLRDTQRRGGEDYGYRLRISAPRPDFDLRVMPSSINIRAGQTLPITVHAVRKDGFTGGIALTLPDAPPGFRLSGARVPPNQDRVQLTLTAPPRGFAQPVALRLEGYARIRGQEVVRQAVAADDVMQAFLYRHLVPVTELLVSVTGRGGRLPLQIVADEPVRIPAGCMTQLRVRVAGTQRGRGRGRGRGARNQPALRYQLELRNPPPGVTIYDVSKARDGADITLLADPTKIQPGTQGNLIFQVFAAPPTPPRNAPQRRRQVRRRLVAILPAVRFEVLPE